MCVRLFVCGSLFWLVVVAKLQICKSSKEIPSSCGAAPKLDKSALSEAGGPGSLLRASLADSRKQRLQNKQNHLSFTMHSTFNTTWSNPYLPWSWFLGKPYFPPPQTLQYRCPREETHEEGVFANFTPKIIGRPENCSNLDQTFCDCKVSVLVC